MKTRSARVLVSLLLVLGVAALAGAQTRTIDPTRFEEAIQAFEAADRAMAPPAGAIVVTGSSSIRRWHPGLKQDLAPLTVIPRGFGGSTMQDVEHFLDRIVLPYKPRAVVIYEGDNDTGVYGVPPAEIASRLEAIVGRIHAALPSTRVYVMSVKPRSGARGRLGQGAGDERALPAPRRRQRPGVLHRRRDAVSPRGDGKVMDDVFIEDGLHLNEKGTRIWAAAIRAALMAGEAQHETTDE